MLTDRKLLAWYKKNGRNLPWRRTRDPYKILVSEMMLQQTQVPRVLLYYKKWLKQFPTWSKLAEASNSEVIRAWAGLGYNRRALALRDIARQHINTKSEIRSTKQILSGKVGKPKTVNDWLDYKGIGPYTAAALAVFTRAERVMPIDTNIRRVLDRLLLGVTFPDPLLDEKIRKQSTKLLSGNDFDLVPQALFDLATSVCKKVPDCANCPLREVCPAANKFLSGRIKTPKAMIKKSNEKIYRNKKYPDRIYRGRILKLVRESINGKLIKNIGSAIDPIFDPHQDDAWLRAMIARMVQDHLVVEKKNRLFLA